MTVDYRVHMWDNNTKETNDIGIIPINEDHNNMFSQILRWFDLMIDSCEMLEVTETPDGTFVFIAQGTEEAASEITIWIAFPV